MKTIHVMAGALVDEAGRVLLARRPDDKHLGGLWELPGGKREPGEARHDALVRELAEELGITVDSARPLIRLRHVYRDRRVLLDVWRVERWTGAPHGKEGQEIEWVGPAQCGAYALVPADVAALDAIWLPACYMITGDCAHRAAQGAFLQRLEQRIGATGVALVQLRVKTASTRQLRELSKNAAQLCASLGAKMLLNGPVEVALDSGAHGVHLSGAACASLRERPVPADLLVGVSCHDRSQLEQAATLGANFAVLSPVLPTRTHPEAQPLGWDRFARLVATAQIPVYALGGVGPNELARARQAGAQGIAAIRALWGDA